MQIVRDLAGYTLGRSDLVRRLMADKDRYVMEQERQNFVYGNEKENIPGCIKNGISEEIANKIFDEMVDFAEYAFNKSHAAAYSVISYQTAYLKYYYPLEYMASLMTSIMDHSTKVSEYILSCRKMGILVLPPDINEGEGAFSVSDSAIRYGLSAIKGVSHSCIAKLCKERQEHGKYKNLKDFLTRMSDKDLNKRTVENFIKAGALDTLEGNRKQFMMIYASIMDSISKEKKNTMEGQMTLFDLVDDSQKQEFDIKIPQVEEYAKETILAFEKEVLGVYISGHPLEEYEEKLQKNISKLTTDFLFEEETGEIKVTDGESVIVGGMITECVHKYTKKNQTMAFITLEDLVGTLEIVVFPRDYEKNRQLLEVDNKVFIRGRVSIEEEKNGKLLCEQIYSFDDTPKEIWLQFETVEDYLNRETELFEILKKSDGNDCVVIYISKTNQMKKLPPNKNIRVNFEIVNNLTNFLGRKNVKVVEKNIENNRKKY